MLLTAGCSTDTDNELNPSAVGDLSSHECAKIGGHIIEGIGCAKDIPIEEMKKMCESNGMKYSLEFNGCIE